MSEIDSILVTLDDVIPYHIIFGLVHEDSIHVVMNMRLLDSVSRGECDNHTRITTRHIHFAYLTIGAVHHNNLSSGTWRDGDARHIFDVVQLSTVECVTGYGVSVPVLQRTADYVYASTCYGIVQDDHILGEKDVYARIVACHYDVVCYGNVAGI